MPPAAQAADEVDVAVQHARITAAVEAHADEVPWRSSRMGAVAKRALDLVIGSAALTAALPVMAAVAVAVRATSPGPVVLRQQRVGLNGKPFTMWKFRSMRAERADGMVHARGEVTRSDPRLTPIGARLRDLRLDELPQLFHVLSGKMSLVGPRPDLYVNLMAYRDPELIRFAMPPGCTGWAMTRGMFQNTWAARQAINIEYVRRWSVGLDLKIILETAGVMLRQEATAPAVAEVPGEAPQGPKNL